MDRIQLRRDTSARWAEINPILLEGEVGYEIDTKLRKIGDGVHRWNDLEYLKAEGVSQETGDSQNITMSQDAITRELSELGSKVSVVPIWEKGGILTTTGMDNNSDEYLDIRARTNYLNVEEYTHIVIKSYVGMYLYMYDSSKTFISAKQIYIYDGIHETSSLITEPNVFYFRLMIQDNISKVNSVLLYSSKLNASREIINIDIDEATKKSVNEAVNEAVNVNSNGLFIENSFRGYSNAMMAASMIKEMYIENPKEDLSGQLRVLLIRRYNGNDVTNTRIAIGIGLNMGFNYELNLGEEIPTGVRYYSYTNTDNEIFHIVIDWNKYIENTSTMDTRCIFTKNIYHLAYNTYISEQINKSINSKNYKDIKLEIEDLDTNVENLYTNIKDLTYKVDSAVNINIQRVNLNVNSGLMGLSDEGTRYGDINYYSLDSLTYILQSKNTGVIFYYDSNKKYLGNSGFWIDLSNKTINSSDFEEASYFRFAFEQSPIEVSLNIILNNKLGLTQRVEKLELNKPKKLFVVVDANGKGDYTTIEDALNGINDTEDNPVTILVMPGIYYPAPKKGVNNIPYNENNRYISIIGINKDTCILKGDVGYYHYQINVDYAILRLNGQILIKNLTIDSGSEKYEEVAIENNWDLTSPHCRAYCIHVDGERKQGTSVIVENCKLINDHFTTLGFGVRPNTFLKIIDCELVSDVSVEKEKLSGFSNYGTLYGHLKSNAEGLNQNLEVIRCQIKNTNYSQAINLMDASNKNYNNISSKVKLLWNVCKTSNTNNSFIKYSNVEHPQIYELDEMNYGNNVSNMNAN